MTMRKRIFAFFFSPKVQNYEFLCHLLQKHLPHRCKLLLSDWRFFLLFQGLSGLPCTSTEVRPGKADGEPFLGLRALCCMLQRMARVCWPCSLLHDMQPTARHAPCCTACILLQGVPPTAGSTPRVSNPGALVRRRQAAPSLCPCNAPVICRPKSHRSLLESLQVLMKY